MEAACSGPPAYRDGGLFVVKSGYEAPKVCVLTGEDVGQDVATQKLFIKPINPWKVEFRPMGIVSLMGCSILPLFLEWVGGNLLLLGFYLVFLAVIGRFYQESQPHATVYCHAAEARKRRLKEWLVLILGYSSLFLMLCALSLKELQYAA